MVFSGGGGGGLHCAVPPFIHFAVSDGRLARSRSQAMQFAGEFQRLMHEMAPWSYGLGITTSGGSIRHSAHAVVYWGCCMGHFSEFRGYVLLAPVFLPQIVPDTAEGI